MIEIDLNDGEVIRQTDNEIDIRLFGNELNAAQLHEEVRRQLKLQDYLIERIAQTTQPHTYRYFIRSE